MNFKKVLFIAVCLASSCALPLRVLAGGLNDNTPLQKTCLDYVTPSKKVTLADIRNFKSRPVRFVLKDEPAKEGEEILILHTHPWIESLYFLEPPDFKRMDTRETADAIRYAEYLKKKNLGFIFVSVFHKMSVPEFDGIVFDRQTGSPLYNVSMKHGLPLYRPLTVSELTVSLPGWANNHVDEKVQDREYWFTKINNNGLERLRRTPGNVEVGIANFHRFKQLALAFGLFNEKGLRPLHLVRDLSEWGMSYEMVTRPEYLIPVEEAIHKIQTNHLTIIWDKDHVLEYAP